MKVSKNGRYLEDDSGNPFFYLADTAWKLAFMPNKAEVSEYLQNRKNKGFTVIVPVLVFEGKEKGLDDIVNRDGAAPFHDHDPARPNEEFFRHIDYILDTGTALGLKFAIIPTWGEYVGPLAWGKGPVIFNKDNARTYGEFLGNRYKDRDVIWVVGGDRNPETEELKEVWISMVEGLKKGDGGRNLVTYHPTGVYTSSQWLHHEPWLDFNMIQTSTRMEMHPHEWILADYNRTPVKPVVDGETRYEHSHEAFGYSPPHPPKNRITPHDVRKSAYGCMLSGAMGHTYGCRDVWSFHVPSDRPPLIDVSMHWKEAMNLPGACQMQYLKKLLTDYPWYRLVPDQKRELVRFGSQERGQYIPAAFSENREFALAYFPDEYPAYLDTTVLGGEKISASWYNPRNGTYSEEILQPSGNMLEFKTPQDKEGRDYVLVLKRIDG